MFAYAEEIVAAVENDAGAKTRDAAFQGLRALGLDDFGETLLQMPSPLYPRLSRLLPAMASAKVQNDWTGNNGRILLRQSCAFIRSLTYNYTRLTGKPVSNMSVLDYGCGYGRLARLMYYFVDTQSVVGLDPWDRSIEECQNANLGPNFLLSDYLPTRLPTPQKFDLAYAFSVFTHLSKRATLSALAAIRSSMAPDGILCMTIRPFEYWDVDVKAGSAERREELKEEHRRVGFAFEPHNRAPVDGDVSYGDTTFTLKWLDTHATGWKRVGLDQSLDDPLQIYIFLAAC